MINEQDIERYLRDAPPDEVAKATYRKVAHIHQDLNGNGRPGLKKRMFRLELALFLTVVLFSMEKVPWKSLVQIIFP